RNNANPPQHPGPRRPTRSIRRRRHPPRPARPRRIPPAPHRPARSSARTVARDHEHACFRPSSGRDQRTSAHRGGSRSSSPPVAVPVTAQLSWRERAQSGIVLPDMATYRTASVLLSPAGTRTPGTAALFAEPARKGGTPPWAGDFRPANSAGNGPKNAVGKTFTLELPDGSIGKVVVQSLK